MTWPTFRSSHLVIRADERISKIDCIAEGVACSHDHSQVMHRRPDVTLRQFRISQAC